MPLHLTIENETSLPDGGPLRISLSGTRGLDIGRDQYLDWTLPDPNRAVSGKHCEVRFREGGYWLHDVSRNGTFVNQNAQRLQEPYRLRHGDRIHIGHYIIRAEIDGDVQPGQHIPAPAYDPQNPWSVGEPSAPPISRQDLRPPRELRPVNPDFQDWRIDLPDPIEGVPIAPLPPIGRGRGATSDPSDDMGWAQGPPSRQPEPERSPIPEPRRPRTSKRSLGPDGPRSPTGEGDTSEGFGQDHEPSRGQRDPAAGAAAHFSADPGRASSRWDERAAARPSAETDSPWGQPSLAIAPVRHLDPDPRPQQAEPARTGEFVERFARGAGIPAEILAWRDPGDLAEEIGALTRLTAENLKMLLVARAEAKRVARASSQTMIQALDNNPLKFTPTVEDALRIMFSRPVSGYLPAPRAMEEGFRDLKTHQVKVYSAMQHALRLLLQDLDPDAVEASLGDDRGLSGLLGSRKARLWDLYATRWDAMTAAHEEGIVDAFMVFFAECYDR